jgi:hypothetical protein
LTASARNSRVYCRFTLINTSLIAMNYDNRDVYEKLAGPRNQNPRKLSRTIDRSASRGV